MGGLARRTTKIHEVRSQGISSVVIDGEGFSGSTDPQRLLKFDTILGALGFTGPEVRVQGERPDTMEELAASSIPLVTLNVTYKGAPIARKPLIVERDGVKVTVFALLCPESIRAPLGKDREVTAQVCVQCHNPQSDDDFVFQCDKVLVHH